MIKMYLVLLMCLIYSVAAQVPPYTETCVQGAYPPKAHLKVPEYVINLDLPPSQRWNQLASDKKNEIRTILDAFKTFIGEFGIIAKEVIYFIDLLGPLVVDALPQPFQDELRGISNATGIEIGEITLYNIFYEIFTVCTSVIAQSPTGKLYHARNLDFGLFMGWDIKNRTWYITEKLRPAIVNLVWQRAGKTVFKSVNYAGYVGILTAVSPGQFTLSMNERFNIDGGYRGIIDLILTGKGTWMGFLTRNTMETAQSFDEAKYMLTFKQMIAPAYFILGGNKTGQACVITRNRKVNGTDIWQMSQAGGWYILETNYDHWKAPFFLDDRRTPANRCMRNMTQNGVGIAGLFNMLSSKPVLNKLTTYTALMQVNSGHLETWLQYCDDPCVPW
ncbi:acid ceramidase-like isoform X2 [Ruditapes philippinarum]|nr:acid ceramidase-like isoform X2 [Ruditapes philippinarum]XP_060561597.1 acid ceramidase-like isoform X2 [Ruditapes philippinarum]XP_060561598.1 acid ceramidase-like isoform X2 [Ruditapes philippinarum]